MTPTTLYANLKYWFRLYRRRLRRALALAGILGLMAPGVSGCVGPLAALASQSVGMIGGAIGSTTEAGVMMAHDQNPNSTETQDQNETEAGFDQDYNDPSFKSTKTESRCNEMILVAPMIAEFRAGQGGALEWRELGVGGSPDAPLWTVLAGKDTPKDGWQPATNLVRMRFTPPFRMLSAGDGPTFIAYAPTQYQNQAEHDELTALIADFGSPVGSFDYNGRTYRYDEMTALPCFPVPP